MRSECKKCGGEMTGSQSTYCRECYNAYKREWYQRNREKEIARSMAYNYANYDQFLARLRRYRTGESYRVSRSKWMRKNREKIAIYDSNKRAKRRYAMDGGFVSPHQWAEIKRRFQYRCAYCKRKAKLTMDHVIPLSRGGKHTPDNIVPACLRCNGMKHAKDQGDFYRSIGYLL